MGNIIGEPINNVILEQIDNRQKLHGAGYNSESVKRDPIVLNYLNNRNSWIKMASGVSISGSLGEQRLKDVFAQSPDQTVTEQEYANLQGTGLAKNLVLFNTIQSFNDNKYTARSGVRDNNLLNDSTNKMYGGLGGNSQGLKPVGGITDIKVETLNRGSIRKATVNIKVYNQFQFNLIELLYLRLGYIMMLEWGWDKYVSRVETIKDSPNTPPKVTIEQMGSTIIEEEWFSSNTFDQNGMLKKIQKKRIDTQGNYDAFFGKVSNFSWGVNQDGSYDIKIDLITLGSVIESINVRKPALNLSTVSVPQLQKDLAGKLDVDKNDNGGYDNSLINNVGSNVISQWLGKTILNFPQTKNYLNLDVYAKANSFSNGVTETSKYFIRLGEFLRVLQEKIFKNVKNGDTPNFKQVAIDVGEGSNRCNYIRNLVPLDPGICVFSWKFTEDFKNALSSKGNLKNITQPISRNNWGESEGAKEFVVEDTYSNIVYGKLMNIYMNIEFLQKELDSNINDKGELSLFQYLQGICKGINKSTGNVTNLEPSIKNDTTIYILEQNPIKGLDLSTNRVVTAPIEILGYDSSGKSNFVQDFKFNTKITPDLMSMISIGATANSADAESIPFNNWNKGLKNRFEEELIDTDNTPTKSSIYEVQTDREEIIKLFQQDMSTKGDARTIDQDGFVSLDTLNYDWEWKYENINDLGWNNSELTGNWETDVDNEQLLDEVVERVWALQARDKLLAEGRKIRSSENLKSGIEENKNIPEGEEYFLYLCSAFGGDTGFSRRSGNRYQPDIIPKNKAQWWDSTTNNSFVTRGMNSFKSYVNNVNVAEYKNNSTQSSLSGFIPVELGLTLEGLSGMKIYNKISINQRFLPPSYPNALKFVIRGTDHEIRNNKWTTNISTISTSITDQKILTPLSTLRSGDKQGPITIKGPIKPFFSTPLTIIDNRRVSGKAVEPLTFGQSQSIDWLIGEMNLNVQNIWRKFLTELSNLYPGYTLKINSTYRSYQRSLELKTINTDNASAGNSPHNYAYGLDMNVVDPNGFVFTKSYRKPWVESGIPEIATKLGMRWGGDFSSYVDCVHFDATPVTKASKINAKKENTGLPVSKWNTKNTDYK